MRLTAPVDNATAALGILFPTLRVGPEVIDTGRARAALLKAHALSVTSQTPGTVRFGELLEALRLGHDAHPDILRRQVMWLVKYGFIEPVRG